ncbi:N6-L-threonylcarbamoyladenine synthase, TsaD subunit [Campylobacter blaseri]|uniref:tRNA N6-adenosine threonylcarbamoyltransferase n=1 Tax=Campylobacter blaseri TaxID=2042961 RepID=A0A2P8R3Y9_9BACT|nr:tRNA (adenosine(37)-N6)-threonylcarbamoyltransferase complex transferase subunit TsaD [Campylobacter blaseri]PSM53208.1 tRNA (adenosine(37)-N6)-threonylcarbamoyltransferase complex transferase subunit TsaD [Campylobacter blaseri]PSM54674.1 tRNA (adenosine(37)-N6)-threonylcarbamoyltransferase complex transferase subunit TsaD [Campylobacter blaseri]QKF86849.1 N6-L-threonylcarbamoyladenine synthase, TsaD subunit [Campylobacter blaseri]
MILGIESSCDDSSLALMEKDNFKLLFYEKISQELEHSKYGGVVPELAARLHTAALPNILEKIKPYFKEILAIAVTNEPGLSVSLISGVSMAKSLSVALNIPLISVNHLIGHIYSLFLDREIELPLGVLLVSGGHTMILEIDEDKNIEILAITSDDSFGESFDKVAKMMGEGYPGGLVIENLAKNSNEDRFKFTIPLKGDKRVEYSFSGLKNQVRVAIEKLGNLSLQDKSDIAYSFQKAACLHIMDKLKIVFKNKKFSKFGVVGGASANLYLRQNLQNLCDEYGCELMLAPLKFCSDNAAMIARVGVDKYKKSEFIDYQNLAIRPRSNLEKL